MALTVGGSIPDLAKGIVNLNLKAKPTAGSASTERIQEFQESHAKEVSMVWSATSTRITGNQHVVQLRKSHQQI